MSRFLEKVERELTQARLLKPAIVCSSRCNGYSEWMNSFLKDSEVVVGSSTNLMGRDVVLAHQGEDGWEEAIEFVCQQSPGRFFVVSPELPRVEALKLEWVADMVLIDEETYTYEVHELGLSA